MTKGTARSGFGAHAGIFYHRLPLMGRAIGLVWSASRGWTVVFAVLVVLRGLIPAGIAALSRPAVDGLVAGQAGLSLLPAGLLAGLLLLSQSLASLADWVRLTLSERTRNRVSDLILGKTASLDPAFFDDQASLDLLHRSRADSAGQPMQLLESVSALCQNALTLIVLAGLLASYSIWLFVLLAGCSLPGLLATLGQALREHAWRTRSTGKERRCAYYEWLLSSPAPAGELRLFDLGGRFLARFSRLRATLSQERIALGRREFLTELLAGLAGWLGFLGGMGWIVRDILAGRTSLGNLVFCYQAFQQGLTAMRSMLGALAGMYRCLLFLEALFSFLETEPRLALPQHPRQPSARLAHTIDFTDVTFAYPGCRRNVLERFRLRLEPGRITAIVGENGAGKSTLIKLLCRFYDPTGGAVTLDGVDLRELDLASLRRHITVLFQEPVRYQATAAENILAGDSRRWSDQAGAEQAAREAGIDAAIQELPKGYQTVLGRWFGDTDPSVGQWQRLALARAFFRQAPIVALDEPTSAMDSWAENDWMAKFRTLTAGRTTLIITHRFTTAMRADTIHVMAGGRIVESGDHETLIRSGGLYETSWNEQMRHDHARP